MSDDLSMAVFSSPSSSSSSSSSSSLGAGDFGRRRKKTNIMTGTHLRQIQMEEEQMAEALVKFTALRDQMSKMSKGSKFQKIQKIFLAWYEPFLAEIDAECELIRARVKGKDRSQYGPYLLMIPSQMLAIITLDTVVNIVLANGNKATPIIKLAKEIGHWVESEVNIFKSKSGPDRENVKWWMLEQIKTTQSTGSTRLASGLVKRIREALQADKWTDSQKVKVGGALIALLMKSAKDKDGDPVFIHSSFFSKFHKKNVGSLTLDPLVFEEMEEISDHGLVTVRHLPMLVPPRSWGTKRREGGYYRLPCSLMRTNSPSHSSTLRRADVQDVLAGLDYLGRIPWQVNRNVFEVIKEIWTRKESVGELPPQENIPLPSKQSCYTVVPIPKDIDGDLTSTLNNSLEEPEKEFNERLYKDMCRRVKMKNSDLHSLRCDTRIKLMIADKFIDDKFYFPFNLDFRGRAYPVPPNLNHIGSDFSRGLLMFDEAKELGEVGFRWLKVHLANLFGLNKISHEDRAAWVDENLDKVMESARDPLGGDRWWVTAEEPFQALAVCFELAAAIDSGSPESYASRLPVHQDGSCNGLQHYAALGLDEKGGAAVNLLPASQPQDVYSGVLQIVLRKLAEDSATELPVHASLDAQMRQRCARLIEGIVDRKVIKQTVMTSVYGVTAIGARSQIEARLKEKLIPDASTVASKEYEKQIFEASRYLASLTLNSLGEMFSSATGIMDWLGQCAAIVASSGHAMSWITPLGLPVVQPYRRQKRHVVKTLLQTVTLSVDSDSLPVAVSKQKTAFPPNFVHSLDASHMLMTSLKMQDQGLTFASVHDSYWTHACDVPIMNEMLRDAFVELYEQPVLETLKESLTARYPDVEIPPIPERGTLDLKSVLDSRYFFH